MTKKNAILLAGGESSRYGGNKALIEIKGRTLIEIIYNKLNSYFDRVIVIANDYEYNFLKGAELREDLIKDKGPLAGLYTGLYYSDSEYNFLAACDMPFLRQEYFSFLESYCHNNYQIIVSEYREFLEPFAAYYHKDLLALIKKNIENNNLRIKSFYKQSNIKIIKENILAEYFDLNEIFFNINYPEDKIKAKKILSFKSFKKS